MVFAHRAGQKHPNDIGRKHRFAARPDGDSSHPEKKEQDIFRLELGYPASESFEEPRSEKRQNRKDNDADPDEKQRSHREGGKDQPERNDRSEVIHKAS